MMRSDYQKASREDLVREVQDLEDAYAEALGDEVDAHFTVALRSRRTRVQHQQRG